MASTEQLSILKQGVEVWNSWRNQNPGIQIDLREADLSGRILEKANLSYAHLDAANLSHARLRRANLTFAELRNANLSHADLCRANLAHTHLEKANLSFAVLKRTMLPFAHISGANFSAAIMRRMFAEDADFRGANLSYAHLENAVLAFSDFSNANLVGANLEGANLSAANFQNTNVSLVKFDQKILLRVFKESRWKPELIWKRRYDLILDTTIRCKGINSSSCFGSQRFKLFIEDQDFLEETLETAWGKRRCVVWWTFADCGRSLLRWVGWSLTFALTFAWIYWMLGPAHIHVTDLDLSFPSFVYCSVTTFTTLGSGDFVPCTRTAAFAFMAEVVLGYVMLGGLISILGGKLVRRGG
jgi:uncharacterized protein YjbI with pentapeptide repeats